MKVSIQGKNTDLTNAGNAITLNPDEYAIIALKAGLPTIPMPFAMGFTEYKTAMSEPAVNVGFTDSVRKHVIALEQLSATYISIYQS